MKRIMLLMLVVSIALLVSPVYGQDAPVTFCGDLVEADCTLLQESAAAMLGVESKSFHLEADFNVSDIPDAPFEALNLRLTGDGVMGADAASALMLQPTDMMGEDMFPLIAEMLRGVAADMTFTLELPEELTALIEESGQSIPNSLPLDVRMVDGVAYINFESVAGLARDGAIPPGWVGLDVAELYGNILPGMNSEAMAGFDMMPIFTEMMQPEALAQFITIQRLPDAEMMGQTMAVFETRLDYVAMLELPAFQEMMQSVLSAQGAGDFDEAVDILRAMYEGLTLVITQHIGLEDKLIHATDMNMEWSLDAFAEQIGEETLPQFSLDLSLTEEALEGVPEVTVPEDAFIFPLEQMIPSQQSG